MYNVSNEINPAHWGGGGGNEMNGMEWNGMEWKEWMNGMGMDRVCVKYIGKIIPYFNNNSIDYLRKILNLFMLYF